MFNSGLKRYSQRRVEYCWTMRTKGCRKLRKHRNPRQSRLLSLSLAYVIPGTRRYGPFRSFASFESRAVFEFGQLLLRATEGAQASLASRRSCKSDVNNACKPQVQSESENVERVARVQCEEILKGLKCCRIFSTPLTYHLHFSNFSFNMFSIMSSKQII